MIDLDKYQILNEGYLFSDRDIFHNRDLWESGKSNICFITGLSGSGKTTTARDLYHNDPGIELVEMDDLMCVKDHFTINELKTYGDLMYQFFTGVGKKYYVGLDELEGNKVPESEYEDVMFDDFIIFAKRFAKTHRNRRFVVEGVSIFYYMKPEDFDEYPLLIKGTSMIKSLWRGTIRDGADAENKLGRIRYTINTMLHPKDDIRNEKLIARWRKYFTFR